MKWWIICLAFVFPLMGCSINVPTPDPNRISPLVEYNLGGTGEEKILVISIDGVIGLDGTESQLGSQAQPGMVSEIREILDTASLDPKIRGILLVIDSPGGEVTASDLIYHELMRFKERTKLPIHSVITSVGASGAYYIAMASERISAHPTAIVGSIGVIMNSINLTGLTEKSGIESVTYKSGKLKDMGSPLKPRTEEEDQLFQNIIMTLYEQFAGIVSKGRNMKIEQVKPLADGRVYTAEQAQKNGLIDAVGYYEDAGNFMMEQLKLPSVTVVTYRRAGSHVPNIYSRNVMASQKINLLSFDLNRLLKATAPRFLYLWSP